MLIVFVMIRPPGVDGSSTTQTELVYSHLTVRLFWNDGVSTYAMNRW